MAGVDIDDAFLAFKTPAASVGRSRADRMALAPHAIGADGKERDRRVAVVTLGHLLYHVLHGSQEDGIVIIRFQETADFIAFCAFVEHPLGRPLPCPVLCGGNAERDLPAFLQPALCRRVEDIPVELALFRLHETPGQAQEHGAHPGKILHDIGRREFRPVGFEFVGVIKQHPTHVRIDQRLAVIHRGRFLLLGGQGSGPCGQQQEGGKPSGKRPFHI